MHNSCHDNHDKRALPTVAKTKHKNYENKKEKRKKKTTPLALLRSITISERFVFAVNLPQSC